MPLWDDLREASDSRIPWMVGGDFNTILKVDEKKGGRGVDLNAIQDVREFVVHVGVSEIEFEGDKFTWCNNQQGRNWVWERLDRILGNGEAFVQLPVLKVRHLTRAASDHSPLLMSVISQARQKSRFIFQKMWLEHKDFKSVESQV